MDFIEKFKDNNNNFTDKIKQSKYIEDDIKNIKKKGFDDISEIFISNYDLNYKLLENNEKMNYCMKKKLELASNFQNFNYNSKFNESLICNGLQDKNNLSTILYLNDYYHCNLIIYNKYTDKFYKTSIKDNNDKLGCIFENNQWFSYENIKNDFQNNDILELNQIINSDGNHYTMLSNCDKYHGFAKKLQNFLENKVGRRIKNYS